jgi:phosphoribosylamine--glycine ligase
VVVFHAGTTRDSAGVLRASGGRVLNVCAKGGDLRAALAAAYGAIDAIDFPDGFFRRDIGWRALVR